jgi:MOSC domain-containing protein YiiM
MIDPILLSVNIGTPQPITGFKAKTGIFKQPVTGPVAITPLDVAGDAVLDRRHHGGRDQAVYLYFVDDYDWWSTQLGRVLAPGTFGENLTIGGVNGQAVAVGDRFTLGDVVLEVTWHRTPCMTLAARMGDRGFVKRFARAGRPGAYCRTITPGHVEAGMAVIHTPFAGERITVTELMALDGVRDLDPAFMRRALLTPIRDKTRVKYEERLNQLF